MTTNTESATTDGRGMDVLDAVEGVRERPILFSAPMVRAILAGTKTQTRRVACKGTIPAQYVAAKEYEPGRWRLFDADHPHASLAQYTMPACPYGVPGDRLWVRETWTWNGGMVNCQQPHVTGEYHELYTTYAADGARRTIKPSGFVPVPEQPPQREGEPYSLAHAPEDFRYTGENTYMDRLHRWWERKIPSIHMPRWASRITLEITGVRVERLQTISEADARAEGIFPHVRGGWHWLKHDSGNPDDWDQFGYRTAALAIQALWESINGAESWEANPWVWVVSFQRIAS